MNIANHPLILRINTNSTVSYFLGFNGLTQSTSGTKTPNKVLLYKNDDIDLPGSDTELIASLDTGCVHTVENYRGTETDLSISVSQIDYDSGTALVTVKAGFTPSPSLSPSKYHSNTPSAQPSINSNILLHENHNPFCTNHPPAWHDADGVAVSNDSLSILFTLVFHKNRSHHDIVTFHSLYSITVIGTEVNKVDVICMVALMLISMPRPRKLVVFVEEVSLPTTIHR